MNNKSMKLGKFQFLGTAMTLADGTVEVVKPCEEVKEVIETWLNETYGEKDEQ